MCKGVWMWEGVNISVDVSINKNDCGGHECKVMGVRLWVWVWG